MAPAHTGHAVMGLQARCLHRATMEPRTTQAAGRRNIGSIGSIGSIGCLASSILAKHLYARRREGMSFSLNFSLSLSLSCLSCRLSFVSSQASFNNCLRSCLR